MSLWRDLKAVFFPPKTRELEEHHRQVRKAVHDERNEVMQTQAKQTMSRRQIDEIYEATRKAVRRLKQQQADGLDRRPDNHGNHRPEPPPAIR